MSAPGWYTDPWDGALLRWWDGTAWTPVTQPAPAWKPITGLVPWVVTGLLATSLLRLFAGPGDPQSDGRQVLLSVVAGLAGLATGVLWLVWFQRAYHDAGLLWPIRFRDWAVLGWLIPVLSLWRPKQMANDLWTAGDPHAERYTTPRGVSGLVHWWWAAYVAGGFIAIAAAIQVVVARSEGRPRPTGLVLTSQVVYAAAGVLAVLFVRRATERLEARRQSALVTPPSTGTTQPVT
jgi:hypothetical protein